MIKYEFDPQNETVGITEVCYPEFEKGEDFYSYTYNVAMEVQTAMLAILSKTCDEIESYLPGISEEDLDKIKKIIIESTSGSIDLELLKEFKETIQ